METLPILHVPSTSPMLPDKGAWIHRFEIKSETSNLVYVVSQHKTGRYWGCSCPGWTLRGRKCKHLKSLGLPCFMVPHEVKLIGGQKETKKIKKAGA